jgi:hypothetical protein
VSETPIDPCTASDHTIRVKFFIRHAQELCIMRGEKAGFLKRVAIDQ